LPHPLTVYTYRQFFKSGDGNVTQVTEYGYEIRIMECKGLYRAGCLMTISRELARYKLILVGVQEVRREGGGTEPAGEYSFLYGNENENYELGTEFSVHKRILAAVTRVEYGSDRISYIILRGR
jgi:hypothetical protein